MWKQLERCAEAGELLVLSCPHMDELMTSCSQPAVTDVVVPDLICL